MGCLSSIRLAPQRAARQARNVCTAQLASSLASVVLPWSLCCECVEVRQRFFERYVCLFVFPAGGTQRTPVRQKMKTMSRSLQMLNFARLNVKAQKSHTDPESLGSGKGSERMGKRRSGDQAKSSSGAMRECLCWILVTIACQMAYGICFVKDYNNHMCI